MNGNTAGIGCVVLLLAGLAGAEYISTTITTDGTSSLATEGLTGNGSYASRIMTVDDASVSRSVSGGEDLASEISVQSRGPVLLSDYASGKTVVLPDAIVCTFGDWMENQERYAEMESAGILSNGQYSASRVAGSGLIGVTDLNGTGMYSFGASVRGNVSLRSHGFVSGNMTVRDFVRYGGKI